jgi:hypothetical protein
VLNLAVIDIGRYFAQGSYGITESGISMPLEAHFSVESFPNAVVLDGKWQQHSGRPTHAFRVELTRDSASQSQAAVTVAASGIGSLTGRMSLRGPTLELLVADSSCGHQLSARLVPLDKPRIYEISGIVSVKAELWFPFHLRVVPMEAESAMSNVVHVLGGRQRNGAA